MLNWPPTEIRTRKHRRLVRLIEQQNGLCALCGKPFSNLKGMTPSADHILPLSEGGRAGVSNWQAAHVRCNSGRNSLPVHVFQEKFNDAPVLG